MVNIREFIKSIIIPNYPQKYCAAQLFSTLIIIRNVSAYYYDFWRSCDTEDCSNDAENTAAHHRNKLQFNTYSHRKQLFYITKLFHNFYCNQINAVLLNRRDFDG